MIASCGFLEDEMGQFSWEGVMLAESVETLGVDLRTRVKSLGAKEKTRRKKCKVRRRTRPSNRTAWRWEVKKLRRGYDASEDVVSTCSRDGSHGEAKIVEADGSCGRKKEHDFAVFVHGSMWPRGGRRALYDGHSALGRRSMDREMELRAERSLGWGRFSRFKRGSGAVMCETRDLGIRWPQWHALMFSDEIKKNDMRFVCPKHVKKDAGAEGPISVLEEVGSKARVWRGERRSIAGSRANSLAKESEGELDWKASQCGQEDLPGRWLDAKETIRYWLVGC